MTRLGVPAPGRFLTNVVVIYLGKASGLGFMQLLRHAVRERQPTALSADDTDPASPAFFFDVLFTDVTLAPGEDEAAGRPVRASVFGVKGMANPHLPTLLAIGHAFIVVNDGAEAPLTATRTVAAKVPADRAEEVYPALVNDDEDAHAMLRTVLEDIARKASGGVATPGNPGAMT
jgi:hypothetical protein